MGRSKIDKETILCKAAQMVNSSADQNLSLKLLAEELGVQSPALYYYFKNLEDLKRELMLYGWRQMGNRILRSMAGISGYEAIRAMAYAFYQYATENQGVFSLMLWYNQYTDKETMNATSEAFNVAIRIMCTLNISETNANHLIRTFRGFLQGFAQLVNQNAFGNPVSIQDSFALSLDVIIEGMKSLEEKSKGASDELQN